MKRTRINRPGRDLEVYERLVGVIEEAEEKRCEEIEARMMLAELLGGLAAIVLELERRTE